MSGQPDHKTLKDFHEFLHTPGIAPSEQLTASTLQDAATVMFPSPWAVLIRLSAIVFAVGLMNLTLCPQFGLGFVQDSGLFDFFMRFGHSTCKIFCGAFFLGSGLFIAPFILRPDDIRILRQHRFLQISALSSIALILFVAAGGSVYFTIALYWLLGAVFGGLFCLEVGTKVHGLMKTA